MSILSEAEELVYIALSTYRFGLRGHVRKKVELRVLSWNLMNLGLTSATRSLLDLVLEVVPEV